MIDTSHDSKTFESKVSVHDGEPPSGQDSLIDFSHDSKTFESKRRAAVIAGRALGGGDWGWVDFGLGDEYGWLRGLKLAREKQQDWRVEPWVELVYKPTVPFDGEREWNGYGLRFYEEEGGVRFGALGGEGLGTIVIEGKKVFVQVTVKVEVEKLKLVGDQVQLEYEVVGDQVKYEPQLQEREEFARVVLEDEVVEGGRFAVALFPEAGAADEY